MSKTCRLRRHFRVFNPFTAFLVIILVSVFFLMVDILEMRRNLCERQEELGSDSWLRVQNRCPTQEQLRKERDRLERLDAQLRFCKRKQSPFAPAQGRPYPLSVKREEARRKAENTARELWYYVNAKMNTFRALAKGGPMEQLVKHTQTALKGYQTTLMNDMVSLRQVDRDDQWRLNESLSLGKLVQRRLEYLQNPKNCQTAKLVLCIDMECGFSCQLTHVMNCLAMAYATQRTLLIGSNWFSGHWNSAFMPLSLTCNNDITGTVAQWGDPPHKVARARILQMLPAQEMKPKPDFMPLAIPEDLAGRLTTFHGYAPAWWLGQLARFLMRPNADMQRRMAEAEKRMGFQRPVVGVHIRRTDKLEMEADYHSLEMYMQHVEQYYDQKDHRETTAGPRRVFLATDDPGVLQEARKKYPRYVFISDNEISKMAAKLERYRVDDLRGVVLDIHFLSMSDFIVCTFSSGICRLSYELMQTRHGDASTYFRSLDDVFHFYGVNPNYRRVVEPHDPGVFKNILSLRAGDFLTVAGNHWNGFSKATLVNTTKAGLFPSYKAVSHIATAKIPTYPEVHELEAEEEEGKG